MVTCKECKFGASTGVEIMCLKHSHLTQNNPGEDVRYVEYNDSNWWCADGAQLTDNEKLQSCVNQLDWYFNYDDGTGAEAVTKQSWEYIRKVISSEFENRK